MSSFIIERKRISELKRADYNPRISLKKGDKVYEQLKRSIDDFGMVEPIVWNKTTGNIVGGHQRLTVLEDRGETEVDVVVVELEEAREKALNLALNKVKGEWDYGSLANIIQDMQDSDFDFTITGFDAQEVSTLLCEATEEFEIEKEEDNSEKEEQKTPDTVKVRIGSYKFELSYKEYEELISQIRLDCGFEKESIIAEYKRRLFDYEA